MADTQSASKRIAELLRERLVASGVRVAELHVIPRIDGLIVSWSVVDGGFTQVPAKIPTWYAEFRRDENALVDKLASALPRRLSKSHWDSKGRLDLQYLFVRVIQDLDRIARSGDDYDCLRVAALLRPLLLDERPLIHQVNRLHQLPLGFVVGRVLVDDVVDSSTLPPTSKPRLVKTRDGRRFDAAGSAFDPETFRGRPQELSLDTFLAALVLKVDDHFVSVRELITNMAYVEGIVHPGAPKGTRPADSALLEWRRMLTTQGRHPILDTVAAIGRVVVASQVALAYECDLALARGLGPRDAADEDNSAE